jgi:hypothetical protein
MQMMHVDAYHISRYRCNVEKATLSCQCLIVVMGGLIAAEEGSYSRSLWAVAMAAIVSPAKVLDGRKT